MTALHWPKPAKKASRDSSADIELRNKKRFSVFDSLIKTRVMLGEHNYFIKDILANQTKRRRQRRHTISMAQKHQPMQEIPFSNS